VWLLTTISRIQLARILARPPVRNVQAGAVRTKVILKICSANVLLLTLLVTTNTQGVVAMAIATVLEHAIRMMHQQL
jgi:hypothetical protein